PRALLSTPPRTAPHIPVAPCAFLLPDDPDSPSRLRLTTGLGPFTARNSAGSPLVRGARRTLRHEKGRGQPLVSSRRKLMKWLLSLVNRFPSRRQVRSCNRQRQGGFRPQLERLEDRTVPSSGPTILKVTSLADSGKDTLRDAILRADKGPSAKTYEID